MIKFNNKQEMLDHFGYTECSFDQMWEKRLTIDENARANFWAFKHGEKNKLAYVKDRLKFYAQFETNNAFWNPEHLEMMREATGLNPWITYRLPEDDEEDEAEDDYA